VGGFRKGRRTPPLGPRGSRPGREAWAVPCGSGQGRGLDALSPFPKVRLALARPAFLRRSRCVESRSPRRRGPRFGREPKLPSSPLVGSNQARTPDPHRLALLAAGAEAPTSRSPSQPRTEASLDPRTAGPSGEGRTLTPSNPFAASNQGKPRSSNRRTFRREGEPSHHPTRSRPRTRASSDPRTAGPSGEERTLTPSNPFATSNQGKPRSSNRRTFEQQGKPSCLPTRRRLRTAGEPADLPPPDLPHEGQALLASGPSRPCDRGEPRSLRRRTASKIETFCCAPFRMRSGRSLAVSASSRRSSGRGPFASSSRRKSWPKPESFGRDPAVPLQNRGDSQFLRDPASASPSRKARLAVRPLVRISRRLSPCRSSAFASSRRRSRHPRFRLPKIQPSFGGATESPSASAGVLPVRPLGVFPSGHD